MANIYARETALKMSLEEVIIFLILVVKKRLFFIKKIWLILGKIILILRSKIKISKRKY